MPKRSMRCACENLPSSLLSALSLRCRFFARLFCADLVASKAHAATFTSASSSSSDADAAETPGRKSGTAVGDGVGRPDGRGWVGAGEGQLHGSSQEQSAIHTFAGSQVTAALGLASRLRLPTRPGGRLATATSAATLHALSAAAASSSLLARTAADRSAARSAIKANAAATDALLESHASSLAGPLTA